MDFTVFVTIVVVIYLVLWFFDSFFKVRTKEILQNLWTPIERTQLIDPILVITHTQSCMHYPYEAFLHGTGLTVKPFRIHWYTTALNRITIKWAHAYPKCFNLSFDAGVLASLLLLPLILLWQMMPFIMNAFSRKDATPTTSTRQTGDDALQFQLMLPGVNLPFDEIVFYTLA